MAAVLVLAVPTVPDAPRQCQNGARFHDPHHTADLGCYQNRPFGRMHIYFTPRPSFTPECLGDLQIPDSLYQCSHFVHIVLQTAEGGRGLEPLYYNLQTARLQPGPPSTHNLDPINTRNSVVC